MLQHAMEVAARQEQQAAWQHAQRAERRRQEEEQRRWWVQLLAACLGSRCHECLVLFAYVKRVHAFPYMSDCRINPPS